MRVVSPDRLLSPRRGQFRARPPPDALCYVTSNMKICLLNIHTLSNYAYKVTGGAQPSLCKHGEYVPVYFCPAFKIPVFRVFVDCVHSTVGGSESYNYF